MSNTVTLIDELLSVVGKIGFDINAIYNLLNNTRMFSEELMSVERSDRDANDVFRTVKHFRDDGTLYRKATLSGGTSPEYTTYTIENYDSDGVTVVETRVYTMTYDNGEMVSRTLVSP